MTKGQIGQDFSNYQSNPQPKPDISISIPNPIIYKEEWEVNKAVSIPNLLPETQMDELWNHYYNQPNNWWNRVIHPDPNYDYENRDPDYYHMYYSPEDDPSYSERDAYAREFNKRGEFSYQYYRVDHSDNKLHPYLSLFQQPKFIAFLEFITGHENLEAPVESTFVSNYQEGHYNGPHTDGPNGRIAFVFHMSRNWRPEYGGVFMRTDWDYLTINKAVNPMYNTLTMFDTTNGGAPHLVSEVVKGCDNKRISYTGWYK